MECTTMRTTTTSGETYRVQCATCGTIRDAGVAIIGDPDDDGFTVWTTACDCGARAGQAIR